MVLQSSSLINLKAIDNKNLEAFVVLLLTSLEIDPTKRVQILDENIYISHSANTLSKVMNPTILPPAMGK